MKVSNKKNTKAKTSKRKKKKSRKGKGWKRIIIFAFLFLSVISLVLFCSRKKIEDTIVRWTMARETPFVPNKYSFDGALFIGNVVNNHPEGPGIMQLEGGAVLAGTWKDGKKEGIFRESDAKHKTTFTLWENDECIGKAKTLKSIHVDTVVCNFLGGGVSETKEGLKQKNKDRKDIIASHYSLPQRMRYCVLWHLTFPLLRGKLSGSKNAKVRKRYHALVNRIND